MAPLFAAAKYNSGLASLLNGIGSTIGDLQGDLIAFGGILYGIMLAYHILAMLISNDRKAEMHLDSIKRITVAFVALVCVPALIGVVSDIANTTNENAGVGGAA